MPGKRVDLTDADIVTALSKPSYRQCMTYVLRNVLASYFDIKNLKTKNVTSRLKRMERDGIVKRVPSSYKVQICWELTKPKTKPDWCSSCGVNRSDPPSLLCVGCQAYKEQQQ